MNGTVTIKTIVDNFATEDLAIKTKDAVLKANADNTSPFHQIICSIESTKLFEDESEINILN